MWFALKLVNSFKGRANEIRLAFQNFILKSIYLFIYFYLIFAGEDLPIKCFVASSPLGFLLISCFWWWSRSFKALIDPVLLLFISKKRQPKAHHFLCASLFFLQKVFQGAVYTLVLLFTPRRPIFTPFATSKNTNEDSLGNAPSFSYIQLQSWLRGSVHHWAADKVIHTFDFSKHRSHQFHKLH